MRDFRAAGAWFQHKASLDAGFSTVFAFQIPAGSHEGFAFVIQNNATPLLGTGGKGLGYDGIANSVAIEFDARRNSDHLDLTAGHMSIHSRGNYVNVSDHSASLASTAAGLTDFIDGDVHVATVHYQPGQLRVFLDNDTSPRLELRCDLAKLINLDQGQAWIGFTADGVLTNARVLNWSFAPAAPALSVALSSPSANAAYGFGAAIPLRAQVSSTGAIARVDFFDGPLLLGSDITPPYEFSWTNAQPGIHWLKTVAHGTDAKRSVSPPVKITAAAASPPIGINFPRASGGVDYPLGPAQIAGVVPQNQWNNLVPVNLGNGNASNLRNGIGSTTPAAVVFQFNGPGEEMGVDTALSPDHQMMRTYVANHALIIGQTTSFIRLTNIPFPVYDVLVYSDGDNRGFERVTEFRIGSESIFLRDQANATFAGHFAEARGTVNQGWSTPAGNYVRFCGLTTNTFTLDVFERSFVDSFRRAVVNAIQIVPAAPVSSVRPLQLARGPYLQSGTPNAMTVCWRTDRPTNSVVRYGTSPGNLNQVVTSPAMLNDHAVRVTGLNPDTRYYYSIGAAGTNFPASAEQYFATSPTQARPVRLWVIGDSGTADYGAASVRDAFLDYTRERKPDLMVMMGDNAYNNGSDTEYQAAMFDMFAPTLAQTVVWSCMGNHEAYTLDIPYLRIFNFPTNGEAGGVPSGSEFYYSFNYANIHFVCLESTMVDRSPEGEMLTWLRADLDANTNQWLIVYVHAPPHSKGSHSSDDPNEYEMLQVRENIMPILESYGVDLVLSGNSHGYERSLLMDGLYGTSDTFGPQHVKQGGTGRLDDTGAYLKPDPGLAPRSGTVSVIAGHGGIIRVDYGLDHPAMVSGIPKLGSVLIDIDGSDLHAKMIRDNGTVADYFSLRKGVPTNTPTQISITAQAGSLNESASATPIFQVTRSGPTNDPIRVSYRVSGAAENGRDIVRLSRSATIGAGQQSVSLPIAPIEDQEVEAGESLTVSLERNNAPFRLAVIPDTRAYLAQTAGGTVAMLEAQARWIAAQSDLAFVLHTGDITENNSAAEWAWARTYLRGPVPSAMVPGDRDGLDSPTAQTTLFNTYFPYGETASRPDFGGAFEAGKLDNCYHYFPGGGIDWLVLVLEFIPRDEVLAWANRVVAAHPERKVIVLTHAHLSEDDTWPNLAQFGRENGPAEVWEKLLRRHANIAFVVSGHTEGDGLGRRVDVGDYGNRVVQLAANFSSQLNGGNGHLRILELDPSQDRLRVQTFSPYLNAFKTDAENQFEVADLGLFKPWHGRYTLHPVSNAATITIQDNDVDNTRPALVSARAIGAANQIVLAFSEALNEADAETLANYALSGFIITSATLLADGKTVVLTVNNSLQDGTGYSISVSGVRDRAPVPNVILPGTSGSFAHRRVFLVEDFNDGNFAGWQVVDEGTLNAPSIWSVPAGKLDQSSTIHGPDHSATENRQGTYLYWSATEALNWNNYVVRATIRTPDDDAVGLMFWFQDSANYYKLEFDRRNSFYKLLAVTSGFEILLAEESGTFPRNSDLQISVEAVDERIYATLNGQPLFGGIVTNAASGSGTVGLYCWNNAGVTFDNVEVVPAPPNAPPSVALTSPAHLASFLTPTDILMSATAADADGIRQVEFFAGQELLGIATEGSPYSLVWSNVPPGEYVLTAIARDNRGFSAITGPVEVRALLLDQTFDSGTLAGWMIVDEGGIQGPSAWQASAGMLIQASNIYGPASDAVDHRRGTFAFWDTPLAYRWRDYELTATLRSDDDDGIGVLFRFRDANNYYKLEFDAQRNFRKLLRKLNGVETTLATEAGGYATNAPFIVRVTVTDGQIEARIDNTLLFGGPVADGTLPVGSIGLYCWGNPAAAFDNIRVSALSLPDQPPLVNILTPTNQSTFLPPADITFSAQANDPDGTVQSVGFLSGTTLLGTTSTRPYTFTWNNVPLGNHIVRARAVDDLGAETFSAPVEISVDYPAGYLVLRNPSLSVPGQFQFRIDAPVGTRLIIEGSPNLQDWTPLVTITNSASPFEFSQPTNQAPQFYRARRP